MRGCFLFILHRGWADGQALKAEMVWKEVTAGGASQGGQGEDWAGLHVVPINESLKMGREALTVVQWHVVAHLSDRCERSERKKGADAVGCLCGRKSADSSVIWPLDPGCQPSRASVSSSVSRFRHACFYMKTNAHLKPHRPFLIEINQIRHEKLFSC